MDLLIEKNSVYPARFCLDDRTGTLARRNGHKNVDVVPSNNND